MRILLVEDDVKIASFIVKGLKAAGYAVDHAPDGEKGLDMALTEPYDTAIIDIMLPKLDGLSLIERMRKEKIHTPVIILSAKGSIDDRVKGLQTGSDDYLTKPFAFSELLARVQALIRRAERPFGANPFNRWGSVHEPPHPGGDERGQEDRTPADRVFLAGISHAEAPDGSFPKP